VIVIDASSLAKYILREENWRAIREILEDEPCSLDIALIEVSNAVWKHFALYGRVSEEAASIMFDALTKLRRDVVNFESFEEYLQEAVEITLKEKIPVYDALYLAQAKKHHSLITSDRRQSETATKLKVKVRYVR